LLLASPTQGREDQQILKCLGQEEKRFHQKKETGPVYDLNQRLIAELVQIPRLSVAGEDYWTICAGEKFSESWKLLELSIRKGKELFVIPGDLTGMQKSITEGMIDDYVEATREILLAFISQIQTQAPTASCLKEEIPELDQFFTEIKYLQEDVDMRQLFAGKDRKIFDRLKNYPLAFEKCRARLKKKASSASTAAPKKS
jgi:hypothetical protein